MFEKMKFSNVVNQTAEVSDDSFSFSKSSKSSNKFEELNNNLNFALSQFNLIVENRKLFFKKSRNSGNEGETRSKHCGVRQGKRSVRRSAPTALR